MEKRDFLKTIGLGAASGLAGAMIARPEARNTTTPDRLQVILQNNKLRLGYTPYSVGFFIDPNTGKRAGIYVDIVEELCRRLSIACEWVEETGWATQIEGLQTKRFDMIGSPVSLTPARARAADFSLPLFYSPIHIWARAGRETAFNRENLDNPDVTILTLEGEQTDGFAKTYFPKAKRMALPQNASFAELLESVATGKGDVTFAEPLAVYEYNHAKGGDVLKAVSANRPLLLVPNILLLPQNEFGLKAMIDNALTDLLLSGFIDATLDKYEAYPNSYVRVGVGR